MQTIHELAGSLPGRSDHGRNPYVMPENLRPELKALWLKTEADNRRHAEAFPARLKQWRSEQRARLRTLQPAGPAPLFNGATFVALDTVEHSIHQALGSLHEADDDDRKKCSDRFDACTRTHPREALRYFSERARARTEDWSAILSVLVIRAAIKGAKP